MLQWPKTAVTDMNQKCAANARPVGGHRPVKIKERFVASVRIVTAMYQYSIPKCIAAVKVGRIVV